MGADTILVTGNKVVLFDSNCLLCNKTVQFLLRADKKNELTYAALSSKLGESLITEHSLEVDSVVFYNQGSISFKSNAFLNICKQIGFPYYLLTVFYIIPSVIRDWLYDLFARNRVHWFGKTLQCLMPSKEISGRVIY